ncbi:methylamine dehydrogenase heavy chain [Amaricoccus macauensis]|uniref:Methylamine dehydrogenase heavy chain n=1 Tax=Amaricoccus macauensis TaxID=57001 RepID=A0A840SJ55_9RHOB|nr:methylamine dehydrogenase (amicyanin) large subunit [Amaricoccus macauensis]MBB5221917.1 methylamine dehydrogenase heavy chain [Amaricoccus macauensis]
MTLRRCLIPGPVRSLGLFATTSLIALGMAFGPASAQEQQTPEQPAQEQQAQGEQTTQTEGEREAAEAAQALASGEADEPVVLNAPKPDARRVYVQDPAHFAAVTQQFVIDGSTGEVIGMTDGGFLPHPLPAADGSFFAQVSTVFKRIARGERTDYVEVFDSETFEPTADIELPDAPRFLLGTYEWMNALTPDNKQLLFYQFSPAPAVGVVDLEGKKFDRMIDVPDCYHIFPATPDVFYMNCRDGSLAQIDISGEEPKVTNTEVFHGEEELLINHPAYSMRAGRLVWPTYTGKIFRADLTAEGAKFLDPIEALTEAERADGWRPGGWQQTAYHRKSDRTFLLVDQRDEWRHKAASRFLVVMDGNGQRIAKFELGHEIDSINVSQDDEPLLYALSAGDQTLYILDAETGEELRSVDQLGRGPQIITTHDMDS